MHWHALTHCTAADLDNQSLRPIVLKYVSMDTRVQRRSPNAWFGATWVIAQFAYMHSGKTLYRQTPCMMNDIKLHDQLQSFLLAPVPITIDTVKQCQRLCHIHLDIAGALDGKWLGSYSPTLHSSGNPLLPAHEVILKVLSSNLLRLDFFFTPTHHAWKDSYADSSLASIVLPSNSFHRRATRTSSTCMHIPGYGLGIHSNFTPISHRHTPCKSIVSPV